MAEVIASTLIEAVFQKLANEAVKQVVRAKGIHSELKKLARTLSRIQALLNDAWNKEITNEAVQVWLNDLQHLAYDIDDLLDDLATEAKQNELTDQSRASASTSKIRKLVPACCTNFLLSNKMSHRLDDITNKLQDLEKEKVTLGLTMESGSLQVKDDRPKDKNRKYETSLLVDASSIVGRQGDKDALVQKLLADEPCNKNFSIVPIVGMGGVGKTTLARLLYDEKQVKDHFELKAWVCVSDEWDSLQISKIIFQSVSGEDKKFEDLNLLQVALRDQLREKRFLLVLDDVWSESREDWETLVRPFHACSCGSKIIMTTRKEQLLKKLGYDNSTRLQRLSQDDAVSLFAQHALGEKDFDSHPTFKAHGEDIVKKCDGLPLALIALGTLMRTKRDVLEWKEIVDTLGTLMRTKRDVLEWKEIVDSQIWRLKEGDEIIPALRLSYRELPADLKQLFAYCSLFAKDYAFDKEDLVLLWMAEGFLHRIRVSKSTVERLGYECFDELLSRSFFQHSPNDESLFVMHDLMNDLATSVAGDFFFRLEKEMGKNVRKQTLDKCRHMSFVLEEYVAYKKFEGIEGAKGLRTLLSVGVKDSWWLRNYLSNKVLVDLLPELQFLRVLSLGGYEISEVPESIGKLKHLRYLNLSQTKITHFPENVCDLYNLETLILFGCSCLTKLPNNFIKLKSLRHLDIRDTPLLKDLPVGVAKLKSLQTLSKIIIGGANGFSISQLIDFENLHGKVSIEGLEKVKNPTEAREADLSQKRLTELEFKWSDVSYASRKETTDNDVLDALKPYNDCLKRLGIVKYPGLEFPKWVGEPSFRKLAHVSIHGCKKCTSLPPLGQLLSLKRLSIQGMHDVKDVGLDFLGTGVAFPSLEILEFYGMPRWEVWSTYSRSGVGDSVFPCLKELSIMNCPNLVEVSLKAPLLSLRDLKIHECGVGLLRSLVHTAPSVTNLKIESISGLTNEVWRGVILDLKAVEEFEVSRCDEIRYLWESKEADASSKVLVNLRMLKVYRCKNLVSLGGRDEEEYNYGRNLLTSLSSLRVLACENFKHLSCPDNIESLDIFDCDSITCVSFSMGMGGQKLKSVTIGKCEKLMIKEELGEGGKKNMLFINSKSMTMLETVWIYDHPNVASIIDFGGNFIHLTELRIGDCKSTEESLFADLQLQSLTSLTFLLIINCPSMDVPTSLVDLVNLRELRIGKLKKPISEWGPLKFPTALVDLTLLGSKEKEEATNWSQLSHLHLPSSLTQLCIVSFDKLETVSEGLQHLVSLQHLKIKKCPKMKDLPEKLLPSLLSLKIRGCPGLKERCSRGGTYWPKISHIPCIKIDYHSQT
ncbi:NB-ARC domains-containing protein [Artemisia annua]|uniref:NB-ARC domains-containing protein n=1 Tax=Artemisia annua TaxID=35608 RepID=A0A2U1MPH1_ARTAN|nr:NB-ARC domains-containing protein [Artemisia annua]